MILVLDVGNTNIEFGLFHNQKGDFTILSSARYFTKINITSDELGFFALRFLEVNGFTRKDINRLVYSSVVPQLNNKIESLFTTYFSGTIVKVSSDIHLGIKNKYKNPAEVGSDRLVNASLVYHEYKKNAVIVDMGTATTVCGLNADGDYLGGVIIPGVLTASQALFDKAAKLPAVSISYKDKVLSDNTIGAIESGIYFSNFYALQGIMKKLIAELQFDNCLKIATGGYSSIFQKDGLFDIVDDGLSIKGLKHISDINS
ncbi:MAG: hypothetical protein A2015_08510 [Spirochaetes bacterium GWF1_31_7]|nr:MAG: hypothetical protein A2Y30_07150 [Spirochaetes bacterium GWE1_32_154]OHD47965.1 MAG: hypothetical protein A2015_08510 [Spirochaetes bacterium GWF1_31_7]OHD48056.1 MAG: hypothetical protein A2Y29_07845 [Spirochaetes bacterium GWE2_31_10]OHD78658.1 MAG: hypothetical protein A2355_16940 [Spirochaetes bacterium RIFOXYB1_FULL_32_8]HBD94095.1 type III pantothenate kinase [Spirochaetia bacterium]